MMKTAVGGDTWNAIEVLLFQLRRLVEVKREIVMAEETDRPQPPYDWLPERYALRMTDFEAGALTSVLAALAAGSLEPVLFDIIEYRPDEKGEPRETTIGNELLRKLMEEVKRVRSANA